MGLLFGPSKTEHEAVKGDLEEQKERAEEAEYTAHRNEKTIDAILDTLKSVSKLDYGTVTELDEPHVAYKALDSGIATLIVPTGATVVVPNNGLSWGHMRKMRADTVRVVRVVDGETGKEISSGKSPTHDRKCTYSVGRDTCVDYFELNKRTDKECAGGIHFFGTTDEAREWYQQES